MRTTLNIDDEVLIAVRQMAAREHKRPGVVVSRLLREVLLLPSRVKEVSVDTRFRPFASRGVMVTDAEVEQLRDTDGI